MKAYRVNVNGNVYEIALEIIDKADIGQVQQKEAASVSAPAAAAPATGVQGSNAVKAPMPGTVLKVNVVNGASVKKGQVLMVLEAMKMENEIMAPCDGVVSSVDVQQGASVDAGAVLCTLA